MSITLHKPQQALSGNVALPGSKSISNRVLMMQALSGTSFTLQNLSDSDDTRHLQQALDSIKRGDAQGIDIGHAGTDMRFLTAYLSGRPGNYQLTGSDRMLQRPIGALVDTLRHLGAEISYINKESFPPLLIQGRKLLGGAASIRGDISSQFITALLLVAPYFENGLQLSLTGQMVSKPYIDMTVALMRQFGAEVKEDGYTICVMPQPYHIPFGHFVVESDWSAASYYYSMVALSPPGTSLSLEGLFEHSLQADALCANIYKRFGVSTRFGGNTARLVKTDTALPGCVDYDFTECPDIAQTLACTCAALRLPFRFSGLQTLKVKETDRILALKQELAKFGFLAEASADALVCKSVPDTSVGAVEIATYNDHRMAMSFAPLSLVHNGLQIADAGVVSKSYPRFWDDLKSIGVRINP